MAEDNNPTTGAEVTPTTEQTTGDEKATVENQEGGDNTQQPIVNDDEPAIPVRKSAQDYIKERRSDRLAKIESGDKKPAVATTTTDDDEPELTPEGRKAIADEVDEKVSPLIKAQREQADEIELRDVLTTHPKFKPFEKLIRKNMAIHTSMPILQLAYAVAGEKLLQLGGKTKTEADKIAQEQNLGASTVKQDTPKEPDFAHMSREEFNKHRNKALGRDI